MNPARVFLLWTVRGYQAFVSPALPRSCRYHPSCSQYAFEAVSEFGVLRGVVLAGWRLLRCNPFSYGGYDPVDRQTLFATCRAPNGYASTAGTTGGRSSRGDDDGLLEYASRQSGGRWHRSRSQVATRPAD